VINTGKQVTRTTPQRFIGSFSSESNGVFDQLQRFSINLISRLPTVE